MLAFEPGPGGRLIETYEDGSVFEIGRVTEWDPPNRLAFTWRQASFAPEMGTQVFVSFESDDPAPAYLREALGPMGEDLPCFSADYGHWDGVLTDCVKNVVRAKSYERAHLAKLLAGNCLRFYGRRLEQAVARRAA